MSTDTAAPSLALRREAFGAVGYQHDTRRLVFLRRPDEAGRPLAELVADGLRAPVCLTWELTYACNLQCVHCLSSSGRSDPRELDTDGCRALIDEMATMGVFYVNIGGGEPTLRPDFWELLEYAVQRRVGVKFSTNGIRITPQRARWLAAAPDLDVQVSLDGATAPVNDAIRGAGSYATALRALTRLRAAGFVDPKLSVVCTREIVAHLDELLALADDHGATLRLTRLRPSGRGAKVWDRLRPLPGQQRQVYDWLRIHGHRVLTGDSFFHLSGYGDPLPGLSGCGAGRVVCLVDPVGDVYACPFAIHDRFRAGNITTDGGLAQLWRTAPAFAALREASAGPECRGCAAYQDCRGGCPAAKFFTGLAPEAPDPECVQGRAAQRLAASRDRPTHGIDHSRRTSLAVLADSPCDQSPLQGFYPDLFPPDPS